jgi:hypothetical protein
MKTDGISAASAGSSVVADVKSRQKRFGSGADRSLKKMPRDNLRDLRRRVKRALLDRLGNVLIRPILTLFFDPHFEYRARKNAPAGR